MMTISEFHLKGTTDVSGIQARSKRESGLRMCKNEFLYYLKLSSE